MNFISFMIIAHGDDAWLWRSILICSSVCWAKFNSKIIWLILVENVWNCVSFHIFYHQQHQHSTSVVKTKPSWGNKRATLYDYHRTLWDGIRCWEKTTLALEMGQINEMNEHTHFRHYPENASTCRTLLMTVFRE
jgi:hypothetical protein